MKTIRTSDRKRMGLIACEKSCYAVGTTLPTLDIHYSPYMVRTWIKKTNRRNWNSNKVESAMTAVM
ncbi:hypothetical protein PR048_027738 [Dryococelus australis]|uniref:Uncharacterized protein n=1 Tax=Dryococelus australis TaxID=614101 RepID=A0ABQ9GHD5_9NEOP|nr:hypothetical protein PR048_027738 [Dryococelus australis]